MAEDSPPCECHDGITRQSQLRYQRAHPQYDSTRGGWVGDHHDSLAVRILAREMINVPFHALRIEPVRTAADQAGKMCERPVLAAARYFLRLRVNCYKSTAGKGPDVRAPVLIQRKIPARNRAAPVAEG